LELVLLEEEGKGESAVLIQKGKRKGRKEGRKKEGRRSGIISPTLICA